MLSFSNPISTWAITVGTPSERCRCASGGLCTALGRAFINEKHGVVVGVRWDKSNSAVFDFAHTPEELETFKGSKYVQSKLTPEIIAAMSEETAQEVPVLFIGLPCQVAAVKEKFGDAVYTVDIICHGSMPDEYLKAELNHLGFKSVSRLSFRSNLSPDFHLRVEDQVKSYDIQALKQPYYYGFLNGIGLRPGCYSCRYARPQRISDLTVGDYIHLGHPYLKDGELKQIAAGDWEGNVSFCSANSQSGENLLQMLGNGVKKERRDYEERLSYGPSLLYPCARPFEDKIFRRLITVLGFPSAIRIAGIHHKTRKGLLRAYVKTKRAFGIKGALFRR